MMKVSVSDKHNTTWKMYGISGNAVFVSEISLFRFLEVSEQLVYENTVRSHFP